MADNLIFPIGFDLEKGVSDAQKQMESVLKRLQKTADGRPLTIPMNLDPSKFTTFEAALRGSIQHITDEAKKLKAALDSSLQTDNSANINRITEAMRNLEAAWKALPNNQKFDINDRLTPKAQKMVQQFNELATASSTYGQTLSQIAGKIKRAADEEARANQKRNDGYAKLRKTLGAQENSIANLSAKIKAYQQILNSKEIGSKSFERVAEKIRKLTENLDRAKARVAALTQTATSGNSRHAASAKRVSDEYRKQETYVSRLIKRMAVYASFAAVGNFLTNVREVTAQFELQRVSLGAILQDANKGEQIFSQIKQFALKSPVSILDLTKYTKQLAAYKIGYDELFDTTKRLTDVSVGLGVSMDRVVLAYGQVRATGHLRASEIRQFTEMGVPIVEELAAKLSKLNGETVTAAQVMDMVSKRAISFEMVKEVFDDMTSAGGMFYNMQEKQGNTLYGLWAKLGDAASVMYDQIGNTETVGKGMRFAIQALTDLMRNWQMVPRMLATVGLATLVYITRQKILKLETAKVAAIQETYNARMARTHMLLSSSSRLTRAHGFALGVQARMFKMASMAANAFGTSLRAIGSAIASTGWGVLVLALGYIVEKLFFAKTNAEKAAEAINKITEETAIETEKSVRNFEYLANKAVNAPKGSKEQKEALEELNRTYSDILPKELLELEYLDKLNGKYGSLTNTIREYIAEQQRRKALDEITNVYGAEKQKYERELTNYFREEGWTEGEIARFWEKFYDVAKDKSKGLQQVVLESVKFAGREGFEDVFKLLESQNSITKDLDKKTYNTLGITAIGKVDLIDMLRDAVLEENQAIEQNEERTKAAQSATNAFAEEQEKAAKRLKEVRLVDSKGEGVDRDSYLGGQMLANFEIKGMTNILKEGFTQAGLVWDAEYGNFIEHINEKTPELISSLNFDAIIDALIKALDNDKLTEEQRKFLENLLSVARQSKLRYDEIVPTDPIVRVAQARFKQIAQSAGGFREEYNQYLMKAGEDMATYNKRLKDEIENLKNRVKALLYTQKVIAKAGIFAKIFYGVSAEELQKDIDETNKTISIIEKTLSEQPDYSKQPNHSKSKNKGSKGTKSDPRLQTLQEIANKMAEVNKEYDELLKKEGQTKALADTQKLFASSFKQMGAVAKKYKFQLPAFEVPQTIEDVQKWYKAIMDNIKRLNLKNADKVLIELGFKSDKAAIDKQQKQIEAELKRLADRISRTKTAKEFYEKILGMTGDIQLSANLTVSVYGQNGQDLQDAIREQIRMAFETDPEKNTTIDLSEAIDPDTGAINYNKLAELEEKYKDVLIDGRADLRKKLIDEGRKTSEAQVQQWLKDIEKAKDFAQQRIDLATYTANQIAAINAREDLPQADKKKLIKGYQDREAKQLAKLQYEEFKDSAMYVHIFEDLDHASTTALKNMRDRLIALKGQWKNLDPMQVKELTKAIADLDEQIAGRSPFKSILDGFKGLADARPQKVIDAEMIAATDELAKREEALAAATRKLTEAQTAQVNAQAEVAQARQNLEDALAVSGGEETATVKAAREVLGIKIATFNAVKAASKDSIAAAKTEVDKAADKYEEQKKVIDKLVEEGKLREANIKKIELANQKIDEYQQQINEALDGIRKMMEAFGASDEDMQFFDDVVGSLNEIVDAGQQATMSVASFMSGNILGGITSGVSAIGGLVSGFTNLFSAGKVRKANKEIKRQQKLLEQLQYTYGRLEAASDKLFGRDYLNNYNQQLKNLQAQQAAYEKQAAAERSKGKKKDKEKIKEYENQARDTADKIKELQEDLVAHLTGSSRTDVARQMAKSWIDARASMSDTFAAIKGNYADLIKNMIVEGAAARVIENALTPVWDSMEKMLAKNDVQGAIDSLINGMDSALTQANNGMEVLWKALEARGYDMKKLIGDTDSEYTGIAKSVAGATSEEINNVAAIGNTLLYYASPIPRIDENLARVVAIMEGRGTALPMASGVTTGAVDYTEMFTTANQHLSSLPRMEQHLAEIHTMLGRALKTKGSTTGFNTFLNS